MKKKIVVLMTLLLTVELLAGCSGGSAETTKDASGKKEIYVLVPGADHGWTAAALDYAKQKAEEINSAGVYQTVVLTATEAKNQQEQIDDLLGLANAPAGIVVLPFDNTMESSVSNISVSGIPFVMYDRILENPIVQEAAAAIVKGDHEGIGRSTAERFIKNGLKPGEKIYVMVGDTSSVPELRTKGFEAALKEAGWTDEDLNSLEFSPVTNWSRATARQIFIDWINNKTIAQLGQYHYIFTHDDEIGMGILEALTGTEIETSKKEVFYSSMEVISSSSGLNEMYQVLSGEHSNTAYRDIVKQFDLFSVTYSPATIEVAIQDMVDYLDGKEISKDHTIPVEVVDAGNVSDFIGF